MAARSLIGYRIALLAVGLMALAVAYPASGRLEFDRSIESMFRPDDTTYLDYQELRQSFGGNSVVILVYEDRELTSADGIARNRAISEKIAKLRGVDGVLSPAKLSSAVEKFQPASFLSSAPALFRQDDVAKGFDDLFAGYTHSLDHSRAAVVAMLAPDHGPDTIAALERIARSLPEEFGGDSESVVKAGALVGEPVLVHDGFSLIERDGARLAIWTVALLSIVVVLSLADLRFVLLTALVILWSVCVTKAIMVWLQMNLSIVSTILTAIVTVIAVTAVLHLGVRFRIARARSLSQYDSARRALSLLMLPIVWTCATDAAGFAALYASRILPIRQFGIMIAIAATAVCVAVFLFAPAIMMLPGIAVGQKIQRTVRNISRRLRRRCLRLSAWSIGHPRWTLMAAGIAIAITLAGIGRTKTETSFLNNFRPNSPVVRAYNDVESRFGGAGVWDVILDAPTEVEAEFLDLVRSLEEDLRAIDVDGARLTKVLSLADAEQIAGKAPLSNLFSSPSSRLSGMYLVMPVFFDALLTQPQSGSRKLRIMLRSREQLPAEQKAALIDEVQRTVDRHVASQPWQRAFGGAAQTPARSHVTGYYVVMARLVGQLVGDQWRCFFASGLLVWLLLCLASGSIRLATVACLANLLPIFLVLALLGLFGGKINMGAAMIAAVSIGLSIDGSVHFLAGYGRYRARGHGGKFAATASAGNIGLPVVLATVALVVGFGVLATSDFIPTATFGTLVAVTLAMGTIVNLTLLPAMVARVDR